MSEQKNEANVLLVEDDIDISEIVLRTLRAEGYKATLAEDGVQALEATNKSKFDLIVLDLGLPGIDGTEVCKQIRESSDVPILILTARDSVDDKVTGFDIGADDYLVKPFEREELLARLKALLRRTPPRSGEVLTAGVLVLNTETHEAHRGDRSLNLTRREFELLEYMMRNEGIVISRQKLLDDVWGYDPFSITNTIDVFISNLRKKLDIEDQPRLLQTVRGIGYKLVSS